MRNTVLLMLLIAFSIIHGKAHPAYGIVVDKNRNIYFADIGHYGRGAVWKLHHTGRLELLLSDFHAHNVNLDAGGNLVTAHGEGTHTMVRIDDNGSVDTLAEADDYRLFNGGKAVYSKQGEIIFGAEGFLWRLNEHGNRQKISDHQFEWNQTLYIDDDGVIYGPDIGTGNGVLVRIDTNGKSEVIGRDLISKLDRPRDKHNDVLLGVTKGCDDHIYITELAGQRVIRIQEDGSHETFYKSDGNWFPTGVDFFAGDAYILEFLHEGTQMQGPRIIKIDEAGQQSELFNYETYEDQTDQTLPGVNQNGFSRAVIYLLLGFGFLGLLIVGLTRKKK